jgi:hypothetical protein
MRSDIAFLWDSAPIVGILCVVVSRLIHRSAVTAGRELTFAQPRFRPATILAALRRLRYLERLTVSRPESKSSKRSAWYCPNSRCASA